MCIGLDFTILNYLKCQCHFELVESLPLEQNLDVQVLLQLSINYVSQEVPTVFVYILCIKYQVAQLYYIYIVNSCIISDLNLSA